MLKIAAFIIARASARTSAFAAAGDAYVYRISNGYNNEVRGKINYRVEKADADRVEVAVTTDTPSAGSARTEIYTKNGNWLRHPLASHDQLREFEFAKPLPVYVPPADAGNSWSVRVDAVEPATGRRNSVRVDGEVARQRTHHGAGRHLRHDQDRAPHLCGRLGRRSCAKPTSKNTDWYAPALGRPVKIDSKSSWQDMSRCMRGGCPWFRGDWNICRTRRNQRGQALIPRDIGH